jgi:hypothetical protein
VRDAIVIVMGKPRSTGKREKIGVAAENAPGQEDLLPKLRAF